MTGPTAGLERWRATLDLALDELLPGLETIERPVLDLDLFALPPIVHRPDWLCLTSQTALAPMQLRWDSLRGVRTAVVGARSADALKSLDFSIDIGPCATVADLLEVWLPRVRTAERVFWPRGSESDEVARALRSKGVLVDDPVAYRTNESRDRRALPAAEFVFFASPSSVRAFFGLERLEPEGSVTAIAIGPTTAAALAALDPSPFAALETLEQPTPTALVQTLSRLQRSQS